MSITQEYFYLQEEYQKKYGEKTIVLLCVGSFYEIYTYVPSEDLNPSELMKRSIGLAKELSIELNITLTRKDKKQPHTIYNPYLIGFPVISYEKNKDILLSKGYTIVKVDQTGNMEKGRKERKIVDIISPGTNIDSPISVSNNIVCIYIEFQDKINRSRYQDNLISVGISSLDITTGNTRVFEVHSLINDKSNGLQEIFRFLISLSPKEVIIYVEECLYVDYDVFLISFLQLNKYPLYIIKINELNKEYMNIMYQNQFLNKVYKRNNTNIFEYLNLDCMKCGIVSYIVILQYIYEHNESLLKRISKPDTSWMNTEKYLQLTYNSILQLHIISNKRSDRYSEYESLFDVLDNTSTLLGKRYLINMLTHPIIDDKILNRFYDLIEETRDDVVIFEKELKGIVDIERLHQKIMIEEIRPIELFQLIKSYNNIINIINLISERKKPILLSLLNRKKLNLLNEFIERLYSVFKVDNLSNVTYNNKTIEVDSNLLCEGVDVDADQCEKDIVDATNKMNQIIEHLGTFIKGSIYNKKEENRLVLYTTIARSKTLKNSGMNKEISGEIEFLKYKGDNVLIQSNKINEYNDIIENGRNKLNKINNEYYSSVVKEFVKYESMFIFLNRFIGEIDYIVCNSRNSIKYKYFRPQIEKQDNAYVEIEGLRHALVERIIKNEYIKNDISLKDNKGLLLYGLNSSGKSCFTKAIGISVIMAQAGMFVPCKMRYSPYSRILTRLTGNDDILKGHSSFAIEMMEINTILINADERALVLGDELTRGTESSSGTGLTASLIEFLVDKGSTFIVSSHMHHLPKYIDRNILIKHILTTYDDINDILIFDRKIRDGQGMNYYGIEVAKSFINSIPYITRANNIRKQLLEQGENLCNTKKSRYNSKLYMDSCIQCGKNFDLHTHHINEQNKADKDGFIEHFHKNNLFNLVVLCENCHQLLHKQKKKIVRKNISMTEILFEVVDDCN